MHRLLRGVVIGAPAFALVALIAYQGHIPGWLPAGAIEQFVYVSLIAAVAMVPFALPIYLAFEWVLRRRRHLDGTRSRLFLAAAAALVGGVMLGLGADPEAPGDPGRPLIVAIGTLALGPAWFAFMWPGRLRDLGRTRKS